MRNIRNTYRTISAQNFSKFYVYHSIMHGGDGCKLI